MSFTPSEMELVRLITISNEIIRDVLTETQVSPVMCDRMWQYAQQVSRALTAIETKLKELQDEQR